MREFWYFIASLAATVLMTAVAILNPELKEFWQHVLWVSAVVLGFATLGILIDIILKRCAGNKNAPRSFSDIAAKVYPHLSSQVPWWKKLWIKRAAVCLNVWLSPKEAFYKFVDKLYIEHYATLTNREQQTSYEIEDTNANIDKLDAKQSKKVFSPAAVPTPPERQKYMDELVALRDKLKKIEIEKEIYLKEAIESLIKQLANGTLTARGVIPPVSHGSQYVEIPALLWNSLTFDNEEFTHASVKDGTLGPRQSYVQIQISKP